MRGMNRETSLAPPEALFRPDDQDLGIRLTLPSAERLGEVLEVELVGDEPRRRLDQQRGDSSSTDA
jgi:hypothetical protein